MTKYKIADVKAEILYGFHPVYEALRAGRRTFHEIYISKQTHTKRIERIRSAAGRKNIPLKEASPAKLETIGGAVSHQGVMARVTAYPLADTDDLLENVLSGARSPFLLLLDHIVDPHNLGAIILIKRTMLLTCATCIYSRAPEDILDTAGVGDAERSFGMKRRR